MKAHNGMKPQDIVVLLFISQYCDGCYKLKDLSRDLQISLSEVSESLHRSRVAKLIHPNKRVLRHSLYEFIIYGLRYVFPIIPGAIVRGVPTSHSGPPLAEVIVSGKEQYVWRCKEGKSKGMEVRPLYRTVPNVALSFPELYELLVLVDALRIGKVREVNLAKEALEERILQND